MCVRSPHFIAHQYFRCICFISFVVATAAVCQMPMGIIKKWKEMRRETMKPNEKVQSEWLNAGGKARVRGKSSPLTLIMQI